METIFVSLVSLALIIVSSVTITISTMQSTNKIADSWKQMEEKSIETRRTDIFALPPQQYPGGIIDMTVGNQGQTNLGYFSAWDVIVQYQDGNVTYLTYATAYPPGDNQWAVKGIFLSNGNPELFNPYVLDPAEQMIASIMLNPEVGVGQSCRITISTPNGISSQIQLTRE
jgi:hypothetical protein